MEKTIDKSSTFFPRSIKLRGKRNNVNPRGKPRGFEKVLDKDYVVLVDENNKVLGIAPKLATHNTNTPLHRGFSVFLFNSKGELLLQQRNHKKKTWPLAWSNSVCGHPKLNEENIDAVKRRVKFELGIELKNVHEILPDFSYKAEMNGIIENEICPVFISFTNQKPIINKEEVEDIKWVNWDNFLNEINQKPGIYSAWCEQEAKLLAKNEKFIKLYKQYVL